VFSQLFIWPGVASVALLLIAVFFSTVEGLKAKERYANLS
jgi:hypothetical protein